MLTSHGTVQGYNCQALVDSKHQVIVHGQAIGKGLDHENLPPVIDGAKENIQSIGKPEDYFEDKVLTADASYHSITNINKCNDEKVDAYMVSENIPLSLITGFISIYRYLQKSLLH